MTTNYWLYADPEDGKTNEIIDIITTQFPQAVWCDNFDHLTTVIGNDQSHVVFMIQPTDGNRTDRLDENIWHNQVKKLVSRPVQCVWFVDELFTISRILDWVSTFSNLLIVTPGLSLGNMATLVTRCSKCVPAADHARLHQHI